MLGCGPHSPVVVSERRLLLLLKLPLINTVTPVNRRLIQMPVLIAATRLLRLARDLIC